MDQQHDLLSSSPNSHTAHYNSSDTMATSLSGMTINDHHHGNQFHKENGIAVGLVRPGDCPMKVRGLYFPSLQPSLVHTFSPFALPVIPHTRRKHCSEHLPPINGRYCNGTAEKEFSEERVDVELSSAEGTSSAEEKQCESPQDSRQEEKEDQSQPAVEVASAGGTAPAAQSKTNGDAEKRASVRPHAAGSKIPAMTAVAKNGKDSPKTPETSGHSSPGTPKSPASKAAGGKPPSTGNEIKKVAVIRSTPKSPKNRSPTSLSAAAPLPDLKSIRSKVGSTDNLKHQPGGGRVQILDQKVDFSNVPSKCGSKANLRHVPGGGNVQILHKKIDLTNVQSKCGSKVNIRHKPGGGNIEIRSEKLEFRAQSKVGSMDNIKHTPGGGNRRREMGRGADMPRDEGFLTPDPSDTPTLSSASMSPEPILLSNPQIKIEDSN
ncbi:microtubule-associated protein tau-like isoform X2 [Sinocyclocheilus grahami]|uniref:microtubule-associated protein tau-like isoform X2 n=1 Tax=Sinocyclocheilus grahami TaxID=75366 RepID=UPI0007AD5A1A|nr:PREDICTED: microtubule-associated protein tau-like isoform X2 [Sinocyclocheilus grahami]